MISHNFAIRKSLGRRLVIVVGLMSLMACAKGGGGNSAFQAPTVPARHPIAPPELPVPLPDNHVPSAVPLTWENGEPTRAAWSKTTFKTIEQEFPALDHVQDAASFCPQFRKLTHEQRVNFWGMLVSEVARYESSWNPASRMKESGMGTDPVTHAHVYSEGLLQMSYQDALWNPGCDFDWNKDKHLPADDPKKTILSPFRNLRCGVMVLAKQINNHKVIALDSGEYWSTLRKGSEKEKEIAVNVRNHLGSCRIQTDFQSGLEQLDPIPAL